jgi:hypothetical protein
MSLHIEIPEPLAGQIADKARSCATSPEHYVLDAVARTLASEAIPTLQPTNGANANPLLGLLADDPELADFLSANAYAMRATLPMRTPRE